MISVGGTDGDTRQPYPGQQGFAGQFSETESRLYGNGPERHRRNGTSGNMEFSES